MYKCGSTTETSAKVIKMSKIQIFRWAWSWSVGRSDWKRDISDLAPGSRTHEGPQGPWKHVLTSVTNTIYFPLPNSWIYHSLWLVDVNQGANFGSCEWNVLVPDDNFQFLWKLRQKTGLRKLFGENHHCRVDKGVNLGHFLSEVQKVRSVSQCSQLSSSSSTIILLVTEKSIWLIFCPHRFELKDELQLAAHF